MPLLAVLLLVVAATEPIPAEELGKDAGPEQPSMELLEFLGSFETIDGDWIDPMTFEEDYESDVKAQKNETHDDEDRDNTADSDPSRPD